MNTKPRTFGTGHFVKVQNTSSEELDGLPGRVLGRAQVHSEGDFYIVDFGILLEGQDQALVLPEVCLRSINWI